jgi:hypothetical protein
MGICHSNMHLLLHLPCEYALCGDYLPSIRQSGLSKFPRSTYLWSKGVDGEVAEVEEGGRVRGGASLSNQTRQDQDSKSEESEASLEDDGSD